MSFKELKIEELSLNPAIMFGTDWCLANAGNKENGYNGMTIAWGQMGAVWDRKTNKGKIIIPTVSVYLRPQRYTKKYFDQEELFTVCTFNKKYKKALSYMGSHSGENEDKIKNAGLRSLFIGNTIAYQEAEMIFVCKKIYHSPILEEGFFNHDIIRDNYPKKDFHEMYIGEVIKVYVNKL